MSEINKCVKHDRTLSLPEILFCPQKKENISEKRKSSYLFVNQVFFSNK